MLSVQLEKQNRKKYTNFHTERITDLNGMYGVA